MAVSNSEADCIYLTVVSSDEEDTDTKTIDDESETRRKQIENDEQLARDLQMKFDHERYSRSRRRSFICSSKDSSDEDVTSSFNTCTRLMHDVVLGSSDDNGPILSDESDELPCLATSAFELRAPPYLSSSEPSSSFADAAASRTMRKGPSPSFVKRLPVFRYKKKSEDDDEASHCSVCLAPYEDGDMLKNLPCFHRFHVKCIGIWLQNNIKCPKCMNPIVNTNLP